MPDDDVRGVSVPGYTVMRRIGAGGFASVFEATQDDIGAPVALKILTTGIGESQAQRRLEREYRSMGRLRDLRGIVPVYGTASTAEGLPVIVMAYMAGGSLLDRINERGPLPAAEVLHITDVICEALGAAHAVGIHHRDIKPENVLIDRYGEPALSDFGLATIEGMRDASQTAASLSPPHAPPEKFLGDGVQDPIAADIYSLASTLHQLLTGRPPFGTSRDGGIASLLLRITGDEAPAIGRDDVPAGLAEAIHRGLSKDPAARPGSVHEFRNLARRDATGPTGFTPPAPLEPSPPPVVTPEPMQQEATRAVGTPSPHESTRIVAPAASATSTTTRRRGRRPIVLGLAAVAVAAVVGAAIIANGSNVSISSLSGAKVSPSVGPLYVRDGRVEFRGDYGPYLLYECSNRLKGCQPVGMSYELGAWATEAEPGRCYRLFRLVRATGLYERPAFNVVCV